MTDIAAIGGGAVGRPVVIEPSLPRGSAEVRESGAVRGGDRVEVSRMASLMSQLREMPDVREDLVRRVREQIAAGEYDSVDRIEGAISGILEEHGR